jgi:hypothetical protein
VPQVETDPRGHRARVRARLHPLGICRHRAYSGNPFLGDSLTFLNRVLVGLTAVLVLFAIPVAIDTFRNVLRWFCG